MLNKLLKYDSKSIFKFLSVFYILSLFFSIVARIFLNIESSVILSIIGKICSGTFVTMIVNIVINNIMRLFVRFRSNLYGDESYLTHTLPVTKESLYLSKIITSVLTTFVSGLVILITLCIAYFKEDTISKIKELLLPIADIYNSSIIAIVLIILALLFLQFINIIQVGYTGIILGHKNNSNKIVYSVIYGFIAYNIIQVLILAALFFVAIFNSSVMDLFKTNNITDLESLKILLWTGIIAYGIIFIVNYFINVKLLKKGVNVD